MNDDELERVMQTIGNRFVQIIQESLEMNYPYAPGYNNKRQVQGQAFKVATGGLRDSFAAVYDPTTKTLGIVAFN